MSILKIILNIIIIILAAIVLTLLGLRVAGFSPYVVRSGSMSPLYETDTVIFAKKVKFEELKPYDVIVFSNSNGKTVTHRIMEIDQQTKQVITKGDNNEFIDVMPVNYSNISGKVYFKIPNSEKIVSKLTFLKGE